MTSRGAATLLFSNISCWFALPIVAQADERIPAWTEREKNLSFVWDGHFGGSLPTCVGPLRGTDHGDDGSDSHYVALRLDTHVLVRDEGDNRLLVSSHAHRLWT